MDSPAPSTPTDQFPPLLAGSDGPQPRFVACFDVLGFKNLVRSTPLTSLRRRYEMLLYAVKAESAVIGLRHDGDHVKGVRWIVPSATFSDTILLWCDDDPGAASAFVATCSALIAEALKYDLPLRGGVAFGECWMDAPERIFLGSALVDAHVTEQSQEWVGGSLHPSCFSAPRSAALLRETYADTSEYEVPVKCHAAPLTTALLWHHYYFEPVPKLQALRERAPREARHKFDNALKFVKARPLSGA